MHSFFFFFFFWNRFYLLYMTQYLTMMYVQITYNSYFFSIMMQHPKTSYNTIFYSLHVLHRLHCLQLLTLKEKKINSLQYQCINYY